MKTGDINIVHNSNTAGYCCDFSINNEKFYADVSYTMLGEPECMIFKYGENRKIDWSGVYYNKDVDVSRESLLSCIKEFAEKEFKK